MQTNINDVREEPDPPQPVAVYVGSSPQTAWMIRGELQHHGIRCAINGDQLADVLSIYGHSLRRVEILVDQTDANAAAHVISNLQLHDNPDERDRWGEHADWRCEHCDEVNGASFDQCWSCERIRTEDAEAVAPEQSNQQVIIDETSLATPATDESPYRPPSVESRVIELGPDHRPHAQRAYRAAITGMMFPIPMSFVALWFSVKSLTREGVNRKAVVAGLLAIPFALFSVAVVLVTATAIVNSFR